MAILSDNERIGKVFYDENGRALVRRIHTVIVQSADGRLHYLTADELPDLNEIVSGRLDRGAHSAEVRLNPQGAKSSPLPSNATAWLSKRDAFIMMFGMFAHWLIHTLAEAATHALK
jgi:hypothetical protein